MANTKSVLFDGSGNLDIPHVAAINFGSDTSQYTVGFWLERSATPSSTEIVLDKTDTNKWVIHAKLNTNGTLTVQQYDGSANPIVTTSDICDNAWHYIVIASSRTTGAGDSLRVDVDGVTAGTSTTQIDTDITNANSLKVGGGGRQGAGEGIDGAYFVDEIVIYNTALSAAVAYSRRFSDHGLNGYSGLVGHYKLADDATDDSSTANDGTLTGAAYDVDVPFSDFFSPSLSPSPSQSPSSSTSASQSPSGSQSPSSSGSASGSASLSPSSSGSRSESPSSSGSRSESPSSSGSQSPSSSTSSSGSRSESASTSASQSPSSSTSASLSPSSSGSASGSASASASPSQGYSLYTRGDEVTLPSGTADLQTTYTDAEEVKVETRNSVYVSQTGLEQYMIHQFKVFVGTNDTCSVEWEGKSSLAPSTSPVLLQIFNQTSVWETIDTENDSEEDVNFELSSNIVDLTNYKDNQNVVTCRVYQLAI